jgi:hypothetical protein
MKTLNEMIDPWNFRNEDSRQADSLPTFIIFCEDEVSEPIYFKYFETTLIKVNPIKNQKSKMDNVFNAILHCKEQGLMDSKEGLFYLKGEDTQAWCVFDRDIETSDAEIQRGHISFDESIETGTTKGFRIAWSNDAFELWILLHFEDIDIEDIANKKRDKYYNRLTEIFMSLHNSNEDLIKALLYQSFNYKQSLKSERNFRSIVRSEIVGRTADAIRRSKEIEAFHNADQKPNHEKTPCTLIHHLVEELIRLGKKEL